MLACRIFRVIHDRVHEDIAGKKIVSHADKGVSRLSGNRFRIFRFFLETYHSVVAVYLDNTESARLLDRNRQSRDRHVGFLYVVIAVHLRDIHFVDVIAAENKNPLRRFVFYQVKVLIYRVGTAEIPVLAGTHLRRDRIDILVETRGKAPVSRNMLIQRIAHELRQDFDLHET